MHLQISAAYFVSRPYKTFKWLIHASWLTYSYHKLIQMLFFWDRTEFRSDTFEHRMAPKRRVKAADVKTGKTPTGAQRCRGSIGPVAATYFPRTQSQEMFSAKNAMFSPSCSNLSSCRCAPYNETMFDECRRLYDNTTSVGVRPHISGEAVLAATEPNAFPLWVNVTVTLGVIVGLRALTYFVLRFYRNPNKRCCGR